eukprot:PhF_6_TR34611/c0_g1_i1/m.50393/K05925/METTL3_14; mRNA (2'-O-methyladenosine-N6-)-methyltransferase
MKSLDQWADLCSVRKRNEELSHIRHNAASRSTRRRLWYEQPAAKSDEDQLYEIPPNSCPIHADVRTFDFAALGRVAQFDVIVMDPPWILGAQSTRGVGLTYKQLSDLEISSIPIHHVQTNGMIFMWVINSHIPEALTILERWGYSFVTFLDWIKTRSTSNLLAAGHGYFLQHAKEACLVAVKGKVCNVKLETDVLVGHRRELSRKPEIMYEFVESLFPGGKYLEIFGRPHNLRSGWVTLGDDL